MIKSFDCEDAIARNLNRDFWKMSIIFWYIGFSRQAFKMLVSLRLRQRYYHQWVLEAGFVACDVRRNPHYGQLGLKEHLQTPAMSCDAASPFLNKFEQLMSKEEKQKLEKGTSFSSSPQRKRRGRGSYCGQCY